jgi:C-terminal processing protease CtpA/Prc
VLRGAGIAGPGPTIELTLAAPGDGEATEAITPIPMGEYNDWAGPYGLFLPDDPRVRSRSRTDEALWFEDAAPGVVYVASMATDGVTSTVLTTLGARLARDDVRAVVVDARHNFGGEVGAVQPVVDTIAAVTGPGRRPRVAVWILTGRNTFSAGSLLVARLARLDGAAVAGEAMGGSPSAWGNPGLVQLGDSGLEASVSTQWEVGADANDRRLTIEPDLAVDITAADVAEGRDPVLDAVIARLR